MFLHLVEQDKDPSPAGFYPLFRRGVFEDRLPQLVFPRIFLLACW